MNGWAESQNNNKSFVIIKTTLRGEYLPNEEMLLVVEIFIFITENHCLVGAQTPLSSVWICEFLLLLTFWLLCIAAGALLMRIYCNYGPFDFHLLHFVAFVSWFFLDGIFVLCSHCFLWKFFFYQKELDRVYETFDSFIDIEDYES